jgi:hypothetical protein
VALQQGSEPEQPNASGRGAVRRTDESAAAVSAVLVGVLRAGTDDGVMLNRYLGGNQLTAVNVGLFAGLTSLQQL